MARGSETRLSLSFSRIAAGVVDTQSTHIVPHRDLECHQTIACRVIRRDEHGVEACCLLVLPNCPNAIPCDTLAGKDR